MQKEHKEGADEPQRLLKFKDFQKIIKFSNLSYEAIMIKIEGDDITPEKENRLVERLISEM